MKIIVFSDSHGTKYSMEEALDMHKSAKDVIFLGDGLRDLDYIEDIYRDRRFYRVAGNCDFGSDEILTDLIELGGKKIFFTHGHRYSVKSGIYELKQAARRAGADIALYGHTHEAMTDYEDGLYIMNPGTVSGSGCGKQTYGIIDILPNGILMNTAKL